MEEAVGKESDQPFYYFEKVFDPYLRLSRNDVEKIDLVVQKNEKDWQALEIKLTVVPDITTESRNEKEWGPELVMRPVSSAYAMMGIATSLMAQTNWAERVKSILKPVYNPIQDWNNEKEILGGSEAILQALSDVLAIVQPLQRPFLIQPIWRSRGLSLDLCEKCFDVFLWSDVAVLSLPLQLYRSKTQTRPTVTRHLREIARHIRALYELLHSGDFNYKDIYRGMPLGNQTDKAFAMSGVVYQRYISHPRLYKPLYEQAIIAEIVQNGGEKCLSPERRFDAAVERHFLKN